MKINQDIKNIDFSILIIIPDNATYYGSQINSRHKSTNSQHKSTNSQHKSTNSRNKSTNLQHKSI